MRTLTYLLAWLILAIPCSAKIIYVDADATGANDGSSWDDAYNSLWIALTGAPSGTEIHVAEGIYKSLNPYSMSPVSRTDTFQLKNGVTIKGGYAGFSEPDPDARDIDSYVSVLSGDIAGNDIAVTSPEQLLTEPTRAENSYHVVKAIGVDSSAVLDGFTITGGQANGGTYEQKYGAGMYNQDASPKVKDCTFSANCALDRGGGMYICYEISWPMLNGCTFSFNHATVGGGIMSYGVPTLTFCTFVGNVAKLGGGMWSNGGELSCCVLGGNRSELKGGGIFMSHDTRLTNCLLSGNRSGSGGAVFAEDSDITVRGCTITGNLAGYVGGVHNDEGQTFVSSCILWNNMDAGGEDESAQIDTAEPPSVNYCCIQGLTGALGGTGNIGANPAFVLPGHWDTTEAWIDGDYHLLSGSPCINTGDPTYIHLPGETDLDGNPRIIGGRIDMGAYEFKAPRIIYVDDDATGNNDGTSWANAYNYLQDALMMASVGDEIRVGQGTYKPDQFVLSKRPNLGRMETFQLKNGVVIKGGYAGFGAPDPDARHAWTYDTILSGDLNGDDVSVNDPCDMGIDPTRAENCLHVVTSSGTDRTAVLDGFYITGGQADGTFPHSHGGGIHNFGGSPTVNWCNIKWNYASGGGGGMSSEGEPKFINCYFVRNSTGGSGGGLYVWSGSATLTGCRFYSNSADWGGGGLAIQTATATLTYSDFRHNSGGINGGGMCCDGGSYTLTDCIFWGNSAERGGALWNIDCTAGLRDNPVLDYCRFYNNEATKGGGMFNSFSTPTVVDCTFRRNSAESFGGGVYNEDGSAAMFEDCAFNENEAEVRGGGMSNHGSSPELMKCTFTSNYAGDGGGGMNNTNDSGPKLLDCLFEENTIFDGGGGGMYNFGNPELTDCAFIGNTAPYESGGGINNYGSLTLTRCIFISNSGARGGGIHCVEGSATLSSCLLIANSGSEWAGGFCSNSSTVALTNCTFTANSSPNGNALGCRSAQNRPPSNVEVTNCILWDGGGEIWNEDSSVISVTYSDVQGGWFGEGNIDADPCFASVGYRGGDGVWVDGDYHLLPDSTCINAGDPGYTAGPNETDLDGNPRVSGGRIDMGVYELQPLRIVYVDADAAGNNDGSSWADAYNRLQDALAAAYFGDRIWVAQGVYRPDAGGGNTSGDREATFQLIDGVTITGGYAGFGEPDPNARDVDVYKTILSGDLAGDDGPDFANNSENSWHVVRGSGTITAILDGFTVMGGNANGSSSYYYSGGGMYNQSSRATILNCTFSENWARDFGGGMYNNNSTPTLANCTFTCNMARDGGGVFNGDSSPTLKNCTFIENTSLSDEGSFGGGMYNSNSNPVLNNCIFVRNMADVGIPDHGGGEGGGIYNWYSNPVLTNCVFTGNRALCGGGGMANGYSSSPTLNSCIFTGNLAIGKEGRWGDGGAIFNASSTPLINNCTFSGNSASRSGGGMFNGSSHPILTNCIFWGDIPEEINLGYKSTVLTTYSDIQGGWIGEGNIDVDPCFVEPGHWDADGVWVGGDYHLLEDSVCINAGDPNYVAGPDETDLDGNARVLCGRIDMGAYEFHCPKIVYVDADATGNNDGSSWADAYNLLQDGLASACEGDEVWVGQGVYNPDQGGGNTPGDRESTFQLKNDLTIKGGYAGFGEPDPDARDVELYETILSGDLDGNDIDVNEAWDVWREPTFAENSYHVVSGSGTNRTAVLDGFTITSGCASGPMSYDSNDVLLSSGAGMLNDSGSPTVLNCTFRKNTTWTWYGQIDGESSFDNGNLSLESMYIYLPETSGAAVFNRDGSPTFSNCLFEENVSFGPDASCAGAGVCNINSSPLLTNCVFRANVVTGFDNGYHGGAMANYSSSPALKDCSFIGNRADYSSGGAIYNDGGSPVLTNCAFTENLAVDGGAILIGGDSSGTLTDCVFEDNAATMYGGSVTHTGFGELNIIRCEFRDGSAERGGAICNVYAPLVLSECILVNNQAKYAGAINTDGDITLTNCLLADNQALEWGGALANMMNTSRSVNCTFVGNSAKTGGAIFSNIECDTIAINSIFWDNTAQTGSQIATSGSHGGSTLTVNYCDIENYLEGLYVPSGCTLNWGEDNIDAEPLFADSGNGNYRLSVGSLCVDTGDNDSVPPDVCDLDGNARIVDGDDDGEPVVDMGAYELGLLPIEVPMKLVPQALNPGSQGKWIKAHFVLPEGYTVEDVDTSRPAEIEQFQLTSESMEVFVNKEDLVEVIAAFNRSAFCGIGPFEGEIAVVGYLTSGRRFRGTDTIKILTNKLKYLGVLATNWLSVCSGPGWCDGADLDQDSVVNFVDFTLMDGCCFEVIKD